jgi:hypothetical protein
MARLKTRFRQQAFKDGGRVNLDQEELPVEQSAGPVTAPSEAPASAPAPVPQPTPIPAAPAASESLIPSPAEIPALKAQLEALRASEGLQQQQQTIADTQTRRLAWVRNNPLAQQHYDRLGTFHDEAMQAGHPDMSREYLAHMENRLLQLNAQNPSPEAQMPTPKFFAPPPAQRPSAPTMGPSSYSAPVSRDVPGSGGRRSPGKITLSPLEVEAAAVAGISVEEYAKQKQKRDQMVASGEYRNQEQR